MNTRRYRRTESWNERLWFLRERLRVAPPVAEATEAVAAAFTRSLPCPKCSVAMQTIRFRGVEVEVCPSCDGIFFDKGEVDRLDEP
jgi:hypothetical protein